MAEIDPIILELRAEMGRYRAELKSSTSLAQSSLRAQERSVQRLEAQMKRSSGAIGASLRGLAGTLGTYFTGRELTGMIDSFTRLQNSLRVAGLEGQALERVQRDLLDLSTRYGVGIEGLANLYGKATDAGRSFGASEAQVLQLTEATSQALLITGTSAAQAQGAILGLSQALASGTVRAEEYNQINEGGLRPLLQAAAASERFGGDINKLRAAMLDGKVSSQGFFNSILAGSQQLEGQASKATLTLSGAFEALSSRLTVYVGESAKANGVTNALAGAMILLADNLDEVVTALSVIIAVIGVQYVAAAARATAANIALAGSATGSAAAMGALGAASFALQARMAGAATSMQAAAFAAKGLGGSLLTLAGGPYGAIIALGAGLAYVIATTNDAAQASAQYQRQQEALRKVQERATEVTEQLATATGKARREALANAKALREETRQYLANAQAALIAAAAKASETRQRAVAAASQASGGGPGEGVQGRVSSSQERFNRARREAIQADANAKAAEANVIGAQKEIARLTKIIEAAAPPAVADVGTGKPDKKSGGGGASGPSAADIEARFQSELASLAQQTLSARQSLATSAEERAELELRAVELARTAALESLNADKDYSEAQKARVRDALENLAEFERERVAREKRLQLEEEAADLADAEFRARSDALRQQYDLARSQSERRRLAFEIIDLEYQERDAALERIKNNKDLNDAVRQRAAIEQAALRDGRGLTMEQARRDTAGPLENYFDRAKMDAEELNEAYQQVAVDGLGSVTNALAETATGFLKLGGVAGRVIDGIISDLIRLAIQQQIVGLFGSIFGGASGLTGTSGGMDLRAFGRASGGYVAPGQTVRVNEHRGGAEYLRMGSQGGTVIPLGQVNQRASQPGQQAGGTVRIMIEEGPNFMSTIRTEATGVAVEVQRAVAPSLIEASAQETQRRMTRPRMPGAGR